MTTTNALISPSPYPTQDNVVCEKVQRTGLSLNIVLGEGGGGDSKVEDLCGINKLFTERKLSQQFVQNCSS